MTTNPEATIDAALREGARLHAFMSGGGLRVIRLERAGRLVGYGEAPTAPEALDIAGEDFAAGCRPYGDVYGKTRPHYLTGQSTPDGPVDAWLRQGRTFDAWAEDDGDIVVKMSGYGETKAPDGVYNRVLRGGETVRWTSRGYTYESSPSRFPNGEACVSTRVVVGPPGRNGADPWMWDIKQTARGATLSDALEAALRAPSVEVPK